MGTPEVDNPTGNDDAIALAEGILMERYQLAAPVAYHLLQSRADATALPICEAARWLLSTGVLP